MRIQIIDFFYRLGMISCDRQTKKAFNLTVYASLTMSGPCQVHVRFMSGPCQVHVGSMLDPCQVHVRSMSGLPTGPLTITQTF